MVHTQYIDWINQTPNLNLKVLTNDVIIQLFAFEHKANNNLTSLDGELLSEKYGKEVFNVAKVITVGKDVTAVSVGDIVSLSDDLLEPITDLSRGTNNEGVPKAGLIALGKLMPFMYLKDKLTTPKNDLLFLIPTSLVKILHTDPTSLLPQTDNTIPDDLQIFQ